MLAVQSILPLVLMSENVVRRFETVANHSEAKPMKTTANYSVTFTTARFSFDLLNKTAVSKIQTRGLLFLCPCFRFVSFF